MALAMPDSDFFFAEECFTRLEDTLKGRATFHEGAQIFSSMHLIS